MARGIALTLAGLVLAGLLPLPLAEWPLSVYIVLTACALGIAASPGALEVLTRTVQEKSIVIASAIWVTLAVGALAVARSHYTDLEIDLLKLSLRIPDARMRSVLDVLLLGILGPIVVEVLEGSERLGKFYQRAVAAGCGLSLAVFVWWIKGPPNSHLVLWATTYYEPGTRFLL